MEEIVTSVRPELSDVEGGLEERHENIQTCMPTKLINSHTGELECKLCGTRFFSSVRPLNGELYYRTRFRCPKGCEVDKDDTQTFR